MPLRVRHQPGRRSLIVESSSEEDKDRRRSNGSFELPLTATTSTAAPCSSFKKPKSTSSSGTETKSKSSSSSSLPQRVSSSPLREAFALAAAKSATARIPAHLAKQHTMPLATALKTAAALDSLQIRRYDVLKA